MSKSKVSEEVEFHLRSSVSSPEKCEAVVTRVADLEFQAATRLPAIWVTIAFILGTIFGGWVFSLL